MLASAYVDYLLNLPFTEHLIPLHGDLVEERRQKKCPTGESVGWNNPAFAQRFTPDKAVEHVKRGGWLGVKIRRGYVCLDVDDADAKEPLRRSYGRQTYSVVTPRGVHLFYATTASKRRTANAVFPRVDWQDSNHYVVAPYAEEERVPNDMPVKPMPIEFLVPPPTEVQQLWNSGRQVYHLRNGDGRNNILFAIGRKIRLFMESDNYDEEELENALYRINDLFAEPLDDSELRKIYSSVVHTPHRSEFISGWQPEGTNGMGMEGERRNPFTEIFPLSSVQEKKRQFLIDGMCREGDVVLVAGLPKAGKSTFVRTIALSLSAENGDRLIPTNRKGWVLWYMLEENPIDVLESVKKAKDVYGVGYEHIQICASNPNVSEPISVFTYGLEEVLSNSPEPPSAVIVDTVGRIFGSGVDINNYSVVQEYIERIRWVLRKFPNPPVLFLVHHLNKGGADGRRTPLGSQAFVGACDVVMTLEDGNLQIVGRGIQPSSIPVHYDAEGDLCLIGAPPSEVLRDLLRSIKLGQVKTLKDAYQFQGGAIKRDINRLLRQGVIFLTSDGVLHLNMFSRRLKYLLGSGGENHAEVIRSSHAEVETHASANVLLADEPPDSGDDDSATDDVCLPIDSEATAVSGRDIRNVGRCDGASVVLHEETHCRGPTLQIAPYSEEEWFEMKIRVRSQEPPFNGELVKRRTVPPALRKALLQYLYLLRRNRYEHLYLSDIDPFTDDTVRLDAPAQNLFVAMKERFGDRVPTAEEILQVWEEQGDRYELVSLLNALYAIAKRPYVCTPSGFVKCIAYAAGSDPPRWALFPLANDDPIEAKRLTIQLASGKADVRVEVPENVKEMAQRGVFFDLYMVGSPVYVLSREHAVIENDKDIEEYIKMVTE